MIMTGFLLVFAFAGTAGAASYEYTDTFTPSPKSMNSVNNWWNWGQGNSSVSWAFDIKRNGFDPEIQHIGAATHTFFWGDFNFKESTLYASTHPVPEPATMLLFGSGLVCLAGIARRRKSAKIRA